jgi:exosortase
MDTATVVSRPNRETSLSRVALWALAALVCVLYAPTVVWLWGRWTLSVWHNAHGLIIPFVVAYFIYQELRDKRHLPVGSSALGFAFLLPAMALQALDAGMHTELLSAVSIVLALPGLALLLIGTARTRAIAFPLAFLAFALPIPLGITENLHLALRHVATAGTSEVVPLMGIPIFVEGTTLHMAQGSLQVADACSGFSTLYAAMAVAFLTAYSTQSPARRAMVLLGAAPIAVASNILRVIVLVVLVVKQGPDVLETWLHPASGMMTFALSLPLIFWLGGQAGPSPARVPVPATEARS